MAQTKDKHVSLPRPNPSISYWQEPEANIANYRSSKVLPLEADVLVIGSGISGASVAYHILNDKPDQQVVVLEARQAASGASGRNGGHTKTASYRSFLENVREVGEEDAVKISKFEYDCMVAVHDFYRDNDIDCDGRRCDTVDIFYDQGHLDEAQASVKKMEELIGDSHPVSKHQFFGPEETKTRFLAEDSLGSIKYEAGSLSAYDLSVGILRLAIVLGAKLYTNTPVVELNKHSKFWRVTTAEGSIHAKKVVMATNGYTAHLLPELEDVIVPFRGIVVAQRPGQGLPKQGNLDVTYSFVYKEGYEYMITRPGKESSRFVPSSHKLDGTRNGHKDVSVADTYDIIIGGGLTKTPCFGRSEFHTTSDDLSSIPETIEDYLHNCTADFFGSNWGKDHEAGRTKHIWSGIMGYSADGHPLVGECPGKEGLWLDASFQGHGMVLCWLSAKACAEMMFYGDDGRTGKLNEWFPSCFRATSARLKKKFDGRIIGRELGPEETVKESEVVKSEAETVR